MSVILETNRLRLRQLTDDDASFILELLNDPAFLTNIGDKGVRDEDGARRYVAEGPARSYEQHGFGLWAVELKESSTPIGMCGLLKRDTLPDVDIGYAFLPQYRAQGYAYEAAEATMRHARETLGIGRVIAIVSPGNESSIRLLEKIGLRFDRTIQMGDDGVETQVFVPREA